MGLSEWANAVSTVMFGVIILLNGMAFADRGERKMAWFCRVAGWASILAACFFVGWLVGSHGSGKVGG